MKLGFSHGLLSYAIGDWYSPELPSFGKHLIAWGDSTYGQNLVPELSNSTSFLMTAVGGYHNVVVADNGVDIRLKCEIYPK